MMKDQYANYVVQKIIEFSDDDQRNCLLNTVKPHLATVRKLPYGKHIISCFEKYTNVSLGSL
jgi:pumilio RNA-binding family